MFNKTFSKISKQAVFNCFTKTNRSHKILLFLSLTIAVSVFSFVCIKPSRVLSIQPFPPCTDTKENCQPTKVKIVSPKNGSTVSGIVEIIPTVVDPIFPLERYEVEYYIDQKLKLKAYIIEPPYKWNTTRSTNGKHTITLNVCNRTGIVGYAAATVYVKNE